MRIAFGSYPGPAAAAAAVSPPLPRCAHVGLWGTGLASSEGFSYLGPGAGPEDLAAVAAPVKDRICFAGEGGEEWGVGGGGRMTADRAGGGWTGRQWQRLLRTESALLVRKGTGFRVYSLQRY